MRVLETEILRHVILLKRHQIEDLCPSNENARLSKLIIKTVPQAKKQMNVLFIE